MPGRSTTTAGIAIVRWYGLLSSDRDLQTDITSSLLAEVEMVVGGSSAWS